MIKVGILDSIPDLAGLIRLLQKHPDVELKWVHSPGKTMPVSNAHYELLGEYDGYFVPEADFSAIDLYIGDAITDELQKAFAASDRLKVIFPTDRFGCQNALPSPKILGLPEFNRKALVRGGRVALQPDQITTLAALALMPLAKNLLLGAPVYGSLSLCDLSARRGEYAPACGYLSQSDTYYLREQILTSLQTSFNAPLHFMASHTAGHIAMATFTIESRMNLNDVSQLYHNFYDDHRHIVIVDNHPMLSRIVDGTNKAAVTLNVDAGTLFISVMFDCRYKIGSANIMHLLNLLFGLDERTGF